MTARKPLVAVSGVLNQLSANDALDPGAGVAFPNGSASGPSAAFNSNFGFYYDAANSGIGITSNGAQVGFITNTGNLAGIVSYVPGGVGSFRAIGETGVSMNAKLYISAATGPSWTSDKARGTISSPALAQRFDTLGQFQFRGFVNGPGSGFVNGANLLAQLIETGTVSTTAMGSAFIFQLCAIGSGTLTEAMRLDQQSGLQMFGTNIVIDQNRAHRLRSTTVSGAITPSVAGNLFFHSDAQSGAGEVAVDTGSAYRHAGQAALKRLTADADATYTPRLDGRIVRDLAAITADRKLTLATTNVTDGHTVVISRRGSSGGHVRNVYQADGTTLIVALADNTSADIIYDATAGVWFQK